MLMMFLCLYKSRTKTLIHTFQIHNHYCLKRSYTTKRITSTTDSIAFRTSFLQNQCGLSGKSLARVSNLLTFEPSDERPISVLKLLQTYGFPQSSITKIISTNPRILQCCIQKYLKPKLEFLVSIGQSETDAVQIVTKQPNILGSSLNNQLLPTFNLLKSVTGNYHNAAKVVKCNPNLLICSIKNCFLPNMEFLFTVGVPESQIVKLATAYGTLLGKKHDQFCKIVMKIKEMGFNLSSSYFIHAVRTLCFLTDSSYESRCEIFRSFGFSNDDILRMFKKQPAIFGFSRNIIRDRMEFFAKKLRWSPSRLLAKPFVLGYSLEKRIIPRCSVLQLLVSKNSISGSFKLSTKMTISEKEFLKHYVTAYNDEIPDIMDAYQGKLTFDVYTFKSN